MSIKSHNKRELEVNKNKFKEIFSRKMNHLNFAQIDR